MIVKSGETSTGILKVSAGIVRQRTYIIDVDGRSRESASTNVALPLGSTERGPDVLTGAAAVFGHNYQMKPGMMAVGIWPASRAKASAFVGSAATP